MAKKEAAPVNDEFDILGLNETAEPDAPLTPAVEAKQAKSRQKVRIMIDEVKGMSNYEVVGVNGNVVQIKRGVPVWVDPAVVHVLENAQTTHIEQKVNKITGEVEDIERTFSAIPWRRM